MTENYHRHDETAVQQKDLTHPATLWPAAPSPGPPAGAQYTKAAANSSARRAGSSAAAAAVPWPGSGPSSPHGVQSAGPGPPCLAADAGAPERNAIQMPMPVQKVDPKPPRSTLLRWAWAARSGQHVRQSGNLSAHYGDMLSLSGEIWSISSREGSTRASSGVMTQPSRAPRVLAIRSSIWVKR